MQTRLRGRIHYLHRRVPRRFRKVEDRESIWISMRTDSRSEAESKADATWAQLVADWEAKLAGDSSDAERRFAAAHQLAAAAGFDYRSTNEIAEGPIKDLLARVDAIPFRNAKPDRRMAAAVLGTVQKPRITVSRALDLYWDLAREKTFGKSPDQVRKWRNPRKKAIKNFIDVVGDKDLLEISGDDMLDFRNWWLDRIETEGLGANSANKDLIHLGEILKCVVRMKRLNISLPLSDLSFRETGATQRPSFGEEWIKGRLLKDGALAGLNEDARGILLAMINTGARPSELAALTPSQIRLTGAVPHISIEPVGRQLKSANARRVIPLCGVSLEALRSRPDGFPRYRDSAASLSATVNKYLRANDLVETPAHTLYGLRHSFEDRMLAAGVDERIRRDLMGHALDRERYGKGASLEHLHRIVQEAAL